MIIQISYLVVNNRPKKIYPSFTFMNVIDRAKGCRVIQHSNHIEILYPQRFYPIVFYFVSSSFVT